MTNPDLTARTDIMRRHVAAIIRMLLGERAIKPSVAILAGEPLDHGGAVELCSMAVESNIDLVHLAFATDAVGNYRLTDISVAVPRDHACYHFAGCRPSMPAGAKRAVIMPRDERQGHFVIAPREIMHFKTRSRAVLEQGLDRAEQRLRQLVRNGIDVGAQGHIHELTEGA